MAKANSSGRLSFIVVLEGLALTIAILYFGKPFLVPLALAVLFAFVLTPIVQAVQRLGLGRVPAVLFVVAISFIAMGGIGWGVGLQVQRLAAELPGHQAEIEQKIAGLRGSGSGTIARLVRMIDEINQHVEEPNPAGQAASAAQPGTPEKRERPTVVVAETNQPSTFERLGSVVAPILEPLAMAGLVIILVVFMLIRREDLRNRILGLLGHGHLTGTTRVFMDTAERVSKFLLSLLLVNAGFGIVFGMGLFLIGVPFAFLWAALATILRFIPYIGSWVALAFPLVLSIAIFPGWTHLVLVLALFGLLELLTANVAEPLLFGHSTGVAPIALLVAAAFWAWVWGAIGLILSTPLTVCLVVLGQHIPRFRFLSLLLGDQPALAPHESYYQRLLAQDKAEARTLALQYVRIEGIDKTLDDVILPALLLARRDRKQGGLTPTEEEFIYQATQELLKEMKEEQAASTKSGHAEAETATEASDVPASNFQRSAVVLGCPAHNEAEEISLEMLGLSLAESGCRMEVVSTKALPAEIENRVEEEDPDVIFIADMPPGGLIQARYLCRRLRKRFRDLPIVVGRWGSSARNFDRTLVQLRSAGASYVTTSICQSKSQILALLRPVSGTKGSTQPAGAC